jgi:hypothetical protein
VDVLGSTESVFLTFETHFQFFTIPVPVHSFGSFPLSPR